MTALQIIKMKSEIKYVVKNFAIEPKSDKLRRLATLAQNAAHLAMIRRGRK